VGHDPFLDAVRAWHRAYLYIAHSRHLENPEDRVIPTVKQMVSGMYDAAMKPAEDDEQVIATNAP